MLFRVRKNGGKIEPVGNTRDNLREQTCSHPGRSYIPIHGVNIMDSKEQRKGVTASDAAAAVGLSKYGDPMSLWQVKTGQVKRTQEENEATSFGNRFEDVVRDYYATTTQNQVQKAPFQWHKNEQLKWLGATPDGIAQTRGGVTILLEIKCPLHAQWKEVPVHYMCQMQLQMEVSHFHLSTAYNFKRVKRNLLYWKWLENRLIYFWHCVNCNQPPSMTVLPNIYYESESLVKMKYHLEGSAVHMERILQQRRGLPPQTTTQMTHEIKLDAPLEVKEKKEPAVPLRKGGMSQWLTAAFVIGILCALLWMSPPGFESNKSVDKMNETPA
ncbi:hypothetical protein PROFUN_02339 [Planoprotostelium fungivorum]|uniref:YqaJ viral recombinase domain-containing protein n=1 Tax=Planoprotostelium fungivorum TaxID=1890364 RepID=A0A2P6NYM9_9EUKA|nr:hypothetical protein PROFUN_02339 [Planoprotostelium fungivorum]